MTTADRAAPSAAPEQAGAKPAADPPSGLARLHRRTIMFAAGMLLPFFFIDLLVAPDRTVALSAIRSGWVALLVGVGFMLGRVSPPAGRRLLWLAGGASPLFYGALVAVMRDVTSPYFGFLLAVPLCVEIALPDEVEAVVAAAASTLVAGLVALAIADASPAKAVLWATCLVCSGALGIYSAVTHHRLRLAERVAQADRLAALAQLGESETRRAAAERLALLGQLAAGVAHEVNNPLAFVKSNLTTLRLDAAPGGALEPAERDAIFEETEEGIRRITRIVSSLKAFSGGDDDGSTIGECDLNAVARDALRLASVRLTGAVPVRVAASAPLPLVQADPHRLTQVVVNLLINAIDAIEGQRGAGRGEIVLRCEAKAAWVELSVEDDGPGLAAAVKERLFQPFFTTKAPGKGTGLGLALSKKYVERFGGELVAEDRRGSGARFTVRLRAA